MDEAVYELVAGAGLEPILMPRKKFIEEHRKLLKVLKSGDPKQLKDEYDEQKKELTELTGGATYRQSFLKRHSLPDKSYSLAKLSKISAVPKSILQEVYNRGVGAYKTQPKSVRLKGSFVKNVDAPPSKKLSKEQWGMSRVYSFLEGNPKHDTDLRENRGGSVWMSALGAIMSVLAPYLPSDPVKAATEFAIKQALGFLGVDIPPATISELVMNIAKPFLGAAAIYVGKKILGALEEVAKYRNPQKTTGLTRGRGRHFGFAGLRGGVAKSYVWTKTGSNREMIDLDREGDEISAVDYPYSVAVGPYTYHSPIPFIILSGTRIYIDEAKITPEQREMLKNLLPKTTAENIQAVQKGFAERKEKATEEARQRFLQSNEGQRQINEARYEEYLRQHPDKRIAENLVSGLTKLGDFAVDTIAPIVGAPGLVSEIYKAFAPPGSKYYQKGTIGQKALGLAAKKLTGGMRGNTERVRQRLQEVLPRLRGDIRNRVQRILDFARDRPIEFGNSVGLLIGIPTAAIVGSTEGAGAIDTIASLMGPPLVGILAGVVFAIFRRDEIDDLDAAAEIQARADPVVVVQNPMVPLPRQRIPEPFRTSMITQEDIPVDTRMTEYSHPDGSVGHIPTAEYTAQVIGTRDATGLPIGERLREYEGFGRHKLVGGVNERDLADHLEEVRSRLDELSNADAWEAINDYIETNDIQDMFSAFWEEYAEGTDDVREGITPVIDALRGQSDDEEDEEEVDDSENELSPYALGMYAASQGRSGEVSTPPPRRKRKGKPLPETRNVRPRREE